MTREEAIEAFEKEGRPPVQRFYDEWFAMREYIEYVDAQIKQSILPKCYEEWLKHEGSAWADQGMRRPALKKQTKD
jgi:hypothetical protein